MNGSRRENIEKRGALIMKISTLVALFTIFGCFDWSSGEKRRNTCNDPPPAFDSKKITPGMYVVNGVGGDTSTLPLYVEIYHSNGILYTRERNFSDTATNAIGSIAAEYWARYLDTSDQIKGIGLGEARGKSSITGMWSDTWVTWGGVNPFNKSNVTPDSFQTLRKRELRDEDGNLIDCVWDRKTYSRIANDQSAWPSQINWPEVWPDSVRRN